MAFFRFLLGRRAAEVPPQTCESRLSGAKPTDGSNAVPCDVPSCDEFDARDLVLHLQEHEGYEVYEYFESTTGRKGSRVLAPRRLWVESFEPAPASPTSLATMSGGSGYEATEGVDSWIVLMPSASPSASPPLQLPRQSKGQGKGRPPPPPGGQAAKAKGPPGRPPAAKAKSSVIAKAAPAPPPFGKRLHWKPLPEPSLGDTIFEEIRGEAAPPLDREQIERIFQPRMRDRASSDVSEASAKGRGTVAGITPVRRPSGSQVCLLDAKRAQNLAIVLRQVTLSTHELAEVLRCMRVGHQVSADTLEHVYENLIPSLLDCAELATYDGPTETLRDVERQLLPLARLPRLKARVRTMLFSKNMPSLYARSLARIRLLRNACEQVRGSSALRRIMCAGLRVGNYLNHGNESLSDGAEVRGFAIESLLKFRDFRAQQSGEVSALHCIVAHLCPHHPELIQQLRRELQAVVEPNEGAEAGSLGTISDLQDAVGCFQSEIDLVQCEIDRFAESYRSESEGPLEVLRRLLEDGCEMSRALNEELRTALATAVRLLEYFGERQQIELQPNGCESYAAVEKFFATIKEFVVSFEECWKDVRDNPRKLGLEGVSSQATLGRNGNEAASPRLPATAAVKQSPKAAAAAACAMAAASAAVERRAKASVGLAAGAVGQCAPAAAPTGTGDATSCNGAALAVAAEAANTAARRRCGGGMMRIGGPDFGAARLGR